MLKSRDVGRSIYLVEKDCLRISNTNDNGDEQNTSFTPECWLAADISGFSTQTPAFYTISASVEKQARLTPTSPWKHIFKSSWWQGVMESAFSIQTEPFKASYL